MRSGAALKRAGDRPRPGSRRALTRPAQPEAARRPERTDLSSSLLVGRSYTRLNGREHSREGGDGPVESAGSSSTARGRGAVGAAGGRRVQL